MNVLVTGATGFVGAHLVDRLLERGDRVTALVRSPQRASALASHGVRLVVGDLADGAAVADAVRDQHVVYHLAARLGARSEAEMLATNRDGTIAVASACARQPVAPRFVLVSSMAAGGPSARGHARTADGNDHPVTMYGRSKLAAERALPPLAIPWVVLRPPVVYGPGDREAFLPLFKAVSFGLAPMFGDGSMELSLVHVSDLADAIVAAGIGEDVNGDAFYIAHPQVVTAADLMRSIAREMRRSVIPLPIPRWAARIALAASGAWSDVLRRPSVLHPDKIHEFFQDAWTGDPTAFMTATGWQPRWDLESGLADTATWYRAERWI